MNLTKLSIVNSIVEFCTRLLRKGNKNCKIFVVTETMDCSESERSLVVRAELSLEPGEEHLAEELVNEAVFEGKMLTTNKEAAGRLRKSKDYNNFMKYVVKAPKDVLKVYKEGYRPPWIEKPPECRFIENNGSAKRNADFKRLRD